MSDKTRWESVKAEGDQIVDNVKRLVHEGNVRRVIVQHEGRTVADRLEQSFSSTPLATIEWDAAGTITRWNPSAERLFQHSRSDALGRNLDELVSADIQLIEAIDLTRRASMESLVVEPRWPSEQPPNMPNGVARPVIRAK